MAHCHHPHHHHEAPPCGHHCHGGRVELIGRLCLTCRVTDHHGHVSYYDIEQGKTYVIEAVSATKGRCQFTGKIVDFDTVKGVEKILTPPHVVNIGAIIVDYSTDYEAKLIRIGVENIVKIMPIETIDCIDKDDQCCCKEEYCIDDPFADQYLEKSVQAAEDDYYSKDSGDTMTTDNIATF